MSVLHRVEVIAWLASFLTVTAAVQAPADEPKNVDFKEDFERGADNWSPFDPSGWTLKKTDAGYVYSQFKKQSRYKPPHRSPLNISLLKEHEVAGFTLDGKVLSTHADYGHRDVCLVFGYTDAAHFYYVHLAKKTDDHANQIFIVNGADRKKISTKTTAGTDWDDKWHFVRVVRDVESGAIEVFFDDVKTPVMTAVDKTFLRGRIGIGSFDDTSDWDDLRLTSR